MDLFTFDMFEIFHDKRFLNGLSNEACIQREDKKVL